MSNDGGSLQNYFIDWRGSTGFARELEFMLEDLDAGLEDPRTGVELVAKFFEADEAVFNSCDDSNGTVGDVFQFTAANLFSKYAARCQDKTWICDLLEKLHRDDDYGVRDALVEKAQEYLPPEPLRGLAERFWKLSEKETDKHAKRSWLILVKLLARQLKDAPLFEKAETVDDSNPGPAARFHIAEAYLEAGDAKTALAWVESIPKKETYMVSERDELLKKIHKKLGNKEAVAEAAWRLFRQCYSKRTLAELLEVIGQNQREKAITEALDSILKDREFSASGVEFLLDVGCADEAETYVLRRAEQMDGDNYSWFLPLAKSFEKLGRLLPASMIYRALLESILGRAQSKYYHHGVRYLKKLDALAPNVSKWEHFPPHTAYANNLRKAHARKASFWSRYNEAE